MTGLLDHSVVGWTALATAAVLVGVSKTLMPGIGTLSAAVFAAVLPARESTAALLLLLIVGDAFALWSYRRDADLAALRRLLPPVLLGVLLGSVFLAASGDTLVRRVIGTILLALVAVRLLGRRWAPDRPPRWQTGLYGTLGGFTTMVANAGGPVMSLYFLARGYSVATFLGTSAWFFAVLNVLKVPFSAGLGLITAETLVLDAILVPCVVVGALVGRRLGRRISKRAFEATVLLLTVLAALNLVR